MKQETLDSLEAGLRTAAFVLVGYIAGGVHETYTSIQEAEKQRIVDSLRGDYKRICEMQAEAAAMPSGIVAILPAWDKVEKVVSGDGKLFIAVPSGLVPPQELDIEKPGVAFAKILAQLNVSYAQAKQQIDGNEGEAVPELQCNSRGQIMQLVE